MRVLRVLHTNIRGLHTAAYVIASLTFGAQCIALLRDRIFAHNFGASRDLDLFYAAFRAPDLLFALTASMVSVFVLIPYLERAQERGTFAVRGFLSEMLTVFSAALAIVAGMVAWYAPELVALAYGSFTETEQATLVSLTRILLIQPFLLGVSNLCSAYVQLRKRFILYATAPILYNLGIIAGAVFAYPRMGLVGLGWGVVLGALLHLGIQTPFMLGERVFPSFTRPDWGRVRNVVRISVPRTLTLSAQQITLFVLVVIASGFSAGSITAFSLATNLAAVPLALIASSYSVAAFPDLTRLFGAGNMAELGKVLGSATRAVIFWSLPTTALFLVLNEQVVTVLLGTGAFDRTAVTVTASVLSVLICSLVAQSLTMLFVRTLYATGNTFLPLLCTAAGTVLTLGIAYLSAFGSLHFDRSAALFGLDRMEGVLGIALAFSFGTFVTAGLLFRAVRSVSGVVVPVKTILKSTLASCALYGVTQGVMLSLQPYMMSEPSLIATCLQCGIAAVFGIVAWGITLRVLRSEELEGALRMCGNALGRLGRFRKP